MLSQTLHRHSREGGNPRNPRSKAMAASLTIGIATLLFLAACGQTPAQVNNLGNDLFEEGDYVAALEEYEEAQELNPDTPELYYNEGNTLYRMEQYDDAIEKYDEALIEAEDDLSALGYFNKGNVYFDREEYPLAIEEYKKVLRIDPENEDAKHNLELALSKIPPQEEQEQGEEPDENQEPGPQQQEQEQPQDQQDQQDEQNEQDQQEQENEEEQDEQQDQQQNNEQDEQQQEQQQQQPTQTEPITPEQARQLLESVSEDAETLQERLQQVLVPSDPPSQNPW